MRKLFRRYILRDYFRPRKMFGCWVVYNSWTKTIIERSRNYDRIKEICDDTNQEYLK